MTIVDIQSPRPRIDISQEIIDRAVRKDSSHCVIADAIKAQVPGATGVTVDLQTIRWTDREKGVRYIFLTPDKFQQVLLAFDYGLPIAPQALRLTGAAQIIEVKASSKGAAKKSAQKRRALEAKETAGEELTSSERQILARSRSDQVRMGGATTEDRPVTHGPATMVPEGGPQHRVVKLGGGAPGIAVLSHGRGRRRRYGMRLAGVPDGMPQESPEA